LRDVTQDTLFWTAFAVAAVLVLLVNGTPLLQSGAATDLGAWIDLAVEAVIGGVIVGAIVQFFAGRGTRAS